MKEFSCTPVPGKSSYKKLQSVGATGEPTGGSPKRCDDYNTACSLQTDKLHYLNS
jgi:hypothetical protein